MKGNNSLFQSNKTNSSSNFGTNGSYLPNKKTSQFDKNVKHTYPSVSKQGQELLNLVTSKKAKDLIVSMYRPNGKNKIGDGSLVAAVQNELKTGQATNNKYHIEKAVNIIRGIENSLSKHVFDSKDMPIMIKERNKLLNAIGGRKKYEKLYAYFNRKTHK